MEIRLPSLREYIDAIFTGNITVLRIPNAAIKTGDILIAKAPGFHSGNFRLAVKEVQHSLLHSITVEEAEREGYIVPDFCPSKNLCENIESRIDLESLALDQTGDIPISRSMDDINKELYERTKKGCVNCALRLDSKDLFLSYWKSTYNDTENREIIKISFEVLSGN
jgi:hypothetical protein